MERLTSVGGVFVMMGIAWLLCPSSRRRAVNLRTVGGGLLILFVFAVIVLKTPVREGFGWRERRRQRAARLQRRRSAIRLRRALHRPSCRGAFVFAFTVLPTIIFFAALMSLLYYVGLMPFIVRWMGRGLARVLGTSGAESFSTVSDVFVGQTEAPLAIRPYIARLTQSELFACMVAGFATTAGGVLAAYVRMLEPLREGRRRALHRVQRDGGAGLARHREADDARDGHSPRRWGSRRTEIPKSGVNVFDALAAGTTDGLKLAVNVGAMLIAFTALVAMLNWRARLGRRDGPPHDRSRLEGILGWCFAPIAWVMGVPSGDVLKVGSLLGQKTVVNEFVAYLNMSTSLQGDAGWLSERGKLIASYALCGFANFASIGHPDRRLQRPRTRERVPTCRASRSGRCSAAR